MMVRIEKKEQHLSICAEERSILYQEKMMKAIPWLLPFQWRSETELLYEKGRGMNILEWLHKGIRETEILDILDAFFKIQEEGEQYLIDEDKFLYDPLWIYWEPISKNLQLLYIPWDFAIGRQKDFLTRLIQLICRTSVEKQWQNERLILMLHRLQIGLKQNQNQPKQWIQWIAKERQKLKETDRIKEEALNILTEKEPVKQKKSWLHIFKEKFPIVIR